MFTERSKPFCAKDVFWLIFPTESTLTALVRTRKVSRPVIAIDFSDHFQFAGSTRIWIANCRNLLTTDSLSEDWSQQE
jgi:hypothetical protein